MWWWYTWRVSLSVLLVVGGVVVLPGWHALGLWPLGVALGADLALGCWSLGVQVRPVEWWVKILTSPVHLACLGALAALAITRQDSSVIIGTIGLVAAFEMAIAIAIGVATLLLHAAESIDVEKEERSEQRLRAERLNLAHWIHDDVCADLQLTSLRLRTGQLSAVEVAAELADLDHRLRLRQQRELIESGEARLAELLQPYVRRAQTAGVSIVAVPRLDDVDVRVDTDTATLFARTLANLVSNSLNAGASELGIEVQVETDGLRVVVTDNAGGFDENDIPPGRGLDSLIAHLGRDHLTVERTTTGSQVTVVIPLLRDGGRVGGAPVAG
jgi:signal transduction histidine kinase